MMGVKHGFYSNILSHNWLEERKPFWQKLELILAKIEKKGHSQLSKNELQEFGGLYRSVAGDLSRIRAQIKKSKKSTPYNSELQVYLNNLIVRAHNQIYRTDENTWGNMINFFLRHFPFLIRRYTTYIAVAVGIFIIALFLSYFYVHKDPSFINLEIIPGRPLVNDEIVSTIEEHRLWTGDKAKVSALASSFIITNNLRVAIGAFIMGVTFGIGTVFILFFNGLLIGTIFGACHLHGMFYPLLNFVAGHGFLELSAIFICGGAGLLIGKALLFPGQYRRFDALKLISKDAFGLFAGCIPLLLIAGTIEGFISTQENIDPSIKYTIGISSFVILLFYIFHGTNFNPSPRE